MRTLALLSEESNRDRFSPQELALIDRIVPWTRTVKPGRTRWREHEGDLMELALAHQEPADTELVLACGRLVERERSAAQAARAAFHTAWSTVDSPKYTRWLRG